MPWKRCPVKDQQVNKNLDICLLRSNKLAAAQGTAVTAAGPGRRPGYFVKSANSSILWLIEPGPSAHDQVAPAFYRLESLARQASRKAPVRGRAAAHGEPPAHGRRRIRRLARDQRGGAAAGGLCGGSGAGRPGQPVERPVAWPDRK